jgi:predicted ATPase/DNA-binding winged helix-turn-helix (wHTH) protein
MIHPEERVVSLPQQWRFASFRIDPTTASLWRDNQLITLPPKPFAVLAYLVSQAGEVVSKETLLGAVWPETVVSEGVLKTCMSQIRQALGETARAPQYIATVHRRGYRFIAPVTRVESLPGVSDDRSPWSPSAAGSVPGPPPLSPTTQMMVAREVELARLHACFALAPAGKRQLVLVTGEAGIGKTTLVDTFISQLSSRAHVWVGYGQCIEHYGAGEAYLPLLEALGQLGRSSDGPRLVHLLRQQAPSWLLQLPALVSPAEVESLQRQTRGTMRERMLRELAEAVESLTVSSPLVLVLEDLHWSDLSTLAWLTYMARRRAAAQFFVLGTYRPVEAIVRSHPIHAVTQELQARGQCVELILAPLTEADVATYLTQRFGSRSVPAALAPLLYQRTNGNPLFLVTVVDELVRQGVLRQSKTGWQFEAGLETVEVRTPESLRLLIEQQLEQLEPALQQLLEAASVVGLESSAAAIAAAMERTVEEVEEQCALLARRHLFLESRGTSEWPDGTVAGRYRFRHALYQDVLYERVPSGRRARMHRYIGNRLEAVYGEQVAEIAAELAVHFVRGRDPQRAVQYLHTVGENALRRSAPQEAIGHLTQGLALCATLPHTAAHMQRELMLQLALANALVATKGYTQDAAAVYKRVRELCQQVGETPQLFPALHGLAATSAQRGELQAAQELCETFFQLAQHEQESALLLQAHRMLASLWIFLGRFSQAREHGERGAALYDAQAHRGYAFQYAQDLGMSCLIYAALALWYLGYPDQAMQRCQEALTLAESLDHPQSLAWAYSFAATLHQLRRETRQAQERAEASIAICREQGYAFRLSRGMIIRGWALTAQGQVEEGMAQMQQGLADHQATGIVLGLPSYLALMAEGCWHGEYIDEGLVRLTEALAVVQRTGECRWQAELYRLQGAFLLRRSPDQHQAAESCWRRALSAARRQQAKSWELRAAISLSRLWHSQGKRDAARALLAPLHGWFTEGFDTADLQEAKALLDELQA